MNVSEWLPAIGSGAASLVVMFYFLDYIRHRDNEMKQIVDRIDSITKANQTYLDNWKTEFLTEVRAARLQNQEIVNSLLAVNRETVAAVSVLAEKVGNITQEVEKLREKLK
jgi:hypothetical protein